MSCREMERQRQLEWERQKSQELQAQRQKEQDVLLKLKAKNQTLTIELGTLVSTTKEINLTDSIFTFSLFFFSERQSEGIVAKDLRHSGGSLGRQNNHRRHEIDERCAITRNVSVKK